MMCALFLQMHLSGCDYRIEGVVCYNQREELQNQTRKRLPVWTS
jgi:hypothetical protein